MIGEAGGKKVLYFAYGSNMDPVQMKERCPSYSFNGVALLRNHKLEFTRYSGAREGGVADVVECDQGEVWGVVYEVGRQDLQSLDDYEGFHGKGKKNNYERVSGKVCLNGDISSTVQVQYYTAVRQPDAPPPSREYLEHLVGGARHWGLPNYYIGLLEQITVRGD